jgi:hypothetical protein
VPRLRIVDTDAPQGVRRGQVRDQEGQVRLFRPTVGRATPDTDAPKSSIRTQPSVVPGRESQTPPAASAPVIRTPSASPPAGAPATSEPPKLSPQQEEPQRQRERRPAGRNQPAAQPPPASTTPHVRTPPAGEPQEQRDRSRPRYQPRQKSPDTQPPTASQPPRLTTPAPPANQGTVVNPPVRQETPARVQPQPAEVRREQRGRRIPQGQQEEDKDTSGQGNVPPAVGSGTPGVPPGNPSQSPAGSRGRWQGRSG